MGLLPLLMYYYSQPLHRKQQQGQGGGAGSSSSPAGEGDTELAHALSAAVKALAR